MWKWQKITDRQHSSRQYSITNLWIGLIAALLLIPILLESLCLGILYVTGSLNGEDTSAFAKQHLLTRLFVSTPRNPVPGTHFLGHLPSGAGWDSYLVADSLLGHRLKSGISVFYVRGSTEYLYVTDDNGFIVDVDDPPIALQKPVDAYRVIVLGGSTVMGEGAPRPSQNIVGMLRKGVRERGLKGPHGKRIEFINAGVDDYNSAHEYLYLVSDLLRFKPDLVVVYDGWNDSNFDLNDQLSPFRVHSNNRRLLLSTSITGSAELLAANLRYFFTESEFKLGTGELLWRVFSWLSYKAHASNSSPIQFDPRNMELYRRNRRAFLALTDDQLSVALFLQPVVGTDARTLSAEEKASWWYPGLDEALGNRVAFYEHARRILADLKARDRGNGHQCIADLSHSLEGVSEPIYADTGHLLPRGNEIVAAHILDELVLCGLLWPAD